MTAAPLHAGRERLESDPLYPGWRAVAACFVMAVFCWGFGFYGHGFYLAQLGGERGWSASLISAATTTYYLVSAVLVGFVGDAMGRFGARAVVVAGTICMAASACLLPVLGAPWQLFATFMLMALGWAALSVAAITTILGAWFQSKRSLAVSLALNGASFGGILVVPALALAAETVGFARAVWFAAAGLGALVIALALVWLGAVPVRLDSTGEDERAATRGQALRSAAFWSVSGPFAIAYLAQVGLLVHQIAILEPAMGRAQTGVAVGLTTVMAVLGRLVLGAAVDRLDTRRITAASFFSQALACLLLALGPNAATLLAASALFGFSVGNVVILPALIVQREFAPSAFARTIALSTSVCQVAYSFGPGLIGILRDSGGGYGAPLALCALLELVAGAAILLGRAKPANAL